MKRSFSSEVREELCKVRVEGRHCALAELAAFIVNSCGVTADGIELLAEQSCVRKRFEFLMDYAFPKTVPAGKILSATGAGRTVNPSVLMYNCCKRSYLRGCFITGGTVNAPGRNYHLEYGFTSDNGARLSNQLKEILGDFEISAKIRSDQPLVYVKEAENIVEALRMMGAVKSLFRFENGRITKELANDINRRVNCETANINKIVNAAVIHINDIRFIAEQKGLGYLSEPLEQVARLRVEHETASLHEIGKMLSPSISKSGVNHRLRKISEIAEEIRSETDK